MNNLTSLLVRTLFFILICTACSFLMNMRFKHILCSVFGGFLTGIIYNLMTGYGFTPVPSVFACGIAVTIYAEVMSVRIKIPSDMFFLTALVPIFPISTLYYSFSFLIMHDIDSASSYLLDSFMILASAGMGILIATFIIRLLPTGSYQGILSGLYNKSSEKTEIKNIR